VEAPLVSVATPLLTTADKRRMGALSGAAAVDMESATVAEVCGRLRRPHVACRILLDPLGEELGGSMAALRARLARTCGELARCVADLLEGARSPGDPRPETHARGGPHEVQKRATKEDWKPEKAG
jgi:hypothetical protein